MYDTILFSVWQANITHCVPLFSNRVAGQWPTTGLMLHYNDVIMGSMASQITSLTIVYSTVYSAADQGKNQSSASLTFVRGIHRGPVNSPSKWTVTRKMFPFDDVIMGQSDVGSLMSKQSGQQCVDRWRHFQSILLNQLYKWVSQMRALLTARCELEHAPTCAI